MNFLRRMGSASSLSSSSSKVTAVGLENDTLEIQQQNRRLGKKKSPKEKELRDKVEELIHTQALLDQSKKALMLKNQEVEELKAKVELLESENQLLIERNSQLEEQLEGASSPHNVTDDISMSETVRIKSATITQLELDLKHQKETMELMRQKYKARIKSLRADSGQKRQDISLKIFELKDEIARLTSDNDELQSQLRAAGVGIATREGAVELDEDTSDSRSHLIIELSSQISDQEYRMSRLESQLEEKDATILDLQQRLSQSSAHQSTGAKTGRGAQYLSQDVKVGKKKRSKVVAGGDSVPADSIDYLHTRDPSSLSRDSGASDLHACTSPLSNISQQEASGSFSLIDT